MASNDLSPNWMSVSAAAQQLGRSVSTIYRWATKRDRLDGIRVGRRRFVRLYDAATDRSKARVSTVEACIEDPVTDPDIKAAAAIESSPMAAVPGLEQSLQAEGQRGLQFRWGAYYRVA